MKLLQHINFTDTAAAFASRSDKELIQMRRLFGLMAKPKWTKIGTSLLIFALKWHFPIKNIIKKTLFKQFCGGETLEECIPVMERLYYSGVRSIPDYAVEGAEGEDKYEATVQELLQVIRQVEDLPMVAYAVFKMTGLARVALLEKKNRMDPLTIEEQAEWERVRGRFYQLVKCASENHVRLMCDAEESWIQDPIDRLLIEAMEEYNIESPIVFMTIQCYRKDSFARLVRIHESSIRNKYFPGFKMVRGAYMDKERERAKELGYPSPIHDSKKACDQMFDEAVEYALEHDLAVLIATHNTLSIEKAVIEMDDKDETQSGFAQLYGMSDNLTFNLSKNGYKVAKYLPYGPLKEVVPYMIRRAEENTSLTGETSREGELIQQEIERRRRLQHERAK
ncbi:MAG: proline dehydrogenase family protein [Cytophagaceae bacterium]|jgi:proline dehydrogenase|nr:proline dehydrogenase family protein [Cytophagaceae bacterium]